MRFFNRDISWLEFNFRVLQEAKKKEVPLYERIQFLSIFSSNLDEFFRVRYTVYNRLKKIKGAVKEEAKQIQGIVNEQLPIFGAILNDDILPSLYDQGIRLYYNEDLDPAHQAFVANYFYTHVLTFLQPIVVFSRVEQTLLNDNALYFFVSLKKEDEQRYGIVNIPTLHLGRFVPLPNLDDKSQFIFIDDVVRTNITKLFPAYMVEGCYAIKLTRNADVDIEDEWSDLFEEQVLTMIRKREKGAPTRLLYEKGMDDNSVAFLKKYFQLNKGGLIEGGRYHNLKDLSSLPNPVGNSLRFKQQFPVGNSKINSYSSVFEAISHSDEMLHLPYHSYNHVLRFFNEAAIAPEVEEISVTLYRVASNSFITNALISAARNGKKVTAFVELKARFDEENNLNWAKKMKAAGVRIIYSIPGIKVHVKLALVKRREGLNAKYYSLLSTGNFNENTARFYTDHILLTSNKGVTKDVDMLFAYLSARKPPKDYPHIVFSDLIVAGFNLVDKLSELIEREIVNKKLGKSAGVTIKVNNLEEREMIALLYKASGAGVTINLIVRGICCLVPGVEGLSENITVRRIVGRYLEHSRVFVFENNGEKEVFVGSADLMNRNIYRRIEVVFPIYNERLKKEVVDIVNLQLADNIQATILQQDGRSLPVENNNEVIDSQIATYKYVSNI
ncbi:MAG: polyphosphate kinase 1 [Flavipsychrobacter sp.]